MFSILINKLRSLSGHTAVLESCDWDEEVMNSAFEDLEDVIKSCTSLSVDELNTHIRKKMRAKFYSDEVIKSLLKLLNTEIQNEINVTRGEA